MNPQLVYALRLLKKDGDRNIKNTYLYDSLSENPRRFGVTENEIELAVELVNTIFPMDIQQQILKKRRTFSKNYLSVIQPDYFDRYFDFEMEGRLDEAEFRTVMDLPLENIKEAILNWNDRRYITSDLKIKLENLPPFAKKEDFEKAMQAIVYFANLPIQNSPYFFNNFNFENFYGKLGGDNDKFNTVLHLLYQEDIECFRSFFKELYRSAGDWRFMLYFVNFLITQGYHAFALSVEELKDLIKDHFIDWVNRASSIDPLLLQFYGRALENFSEPGTIILVPIGRGIQMTDAMRLLIEKDVIPFLSLNIYKDGRTGAYMIGNWDMVIFGSKEAFMEFLDRQVTNPAIEEYKRFCAVLKSDDPGFRFLTLDVK